MHENFSSQIQNYCRKIDVVTVKGSNTPIGLYTIDIEYDFFEAGKEEFLSKEAKSLINRMKKNEINQMLENDSMVGMNIFREDKEIKSMIGWAENIEFQQIFSEGFNAYVNGNWELARMKLEKSKEIRGDDGPSSTLLHYMAETGFRAPDSWRGYRELTEK